MEFKRILTLKQKKSPQQVSWVFCQEKDISGKIFFAFQPNEESYPHHHPKFDIEEKALVLGTELYYRFALAYLKEVVSWKKVNPPETGHVQYGLAKKNT